LLVLWNLNDGSIYIYLYHYQNALQTPTSNTRLTRRLYSVHVACLLHAHGALEDPTTLSQSPHSALSNTLCKRQTAGFILSMLKINTAAWCTTKKRLMHSGNTHLFHLLWNLLVENGDVPKQHNPVWNHYFKWLCIYNYKRWITRFGKNVPSYNIV